MPTIPESVWAHFHDPRLPEGWGVIRSLVLRKNDSPPNGGVFVAALDGWLNHSKYTNRALGFRGVSYKENIRVGEYHDIVFDGSPGTEHGHYGRFAVPTIDLVQSGLDVLDVVPPVNLKPFPGRISSLDENGNVWGWEPGEGGYEEIEDEQPSSPLHIVQTKVAAPSSCRWCGRQVTRRSYRSSLFCNNSCALLYALEAADPSFVVTGDLAGYLLTHPKAPVRSERRA